MNIEVEPRCPRATVENGAVTQCSFTTNDNQLTRDKRGNVDTLTAPLYDDCFSSIERLFAGK